MKYLIKYKLYENQNITEIIQDIDDICLELKDEGFTIIRHSSSFKGFLDKERESYLEIIKMIDEIEQPFEYEEVEDVVERLKDFMSQNGFKTEVNLRKSPFMHFVNKKMIEEKEELWKIVLKFTLL